MGCRGCGLSYLNPRPEDEGLAAYYPKDFYDGLEPGGRDRTEQQFSSRRTRRKMMRLVLSLMHMWVFGFSGIETLFKHADKEALRAEVVR